MMIRNDIHQIDTYIPGKPIEEVRRELGIKGIIKLASNENPLGPSPMAAAAAAHELKGVHRYPEGTCFYLKKKLAAKLNIDKDRLLFGNGSDELIDIILKTIKNQGGEIITADITFVEYRISAKINGFAVKTVPLKNFRFDLDGVARAVTKKTRAVFIANPNNPTGTYVTAREVGKFLKNIPKDVLVVFDEAYFEYVQEKDFPSLTGAGGKKNVIILRTFSKIYGLAGLRIGYMVAPTPFVGAAERVRQPFNVNSVAQAAAAAACDDIAFVKKSVALVAREKKRLCDAFLKLGLWYQKSATNFIFVRFKTDSRTLFNKLLKKGVIIRDMGFYNLNHYARITVGTQKENNRLIAALHDLKGEL